MTRVLVVLALLASAAAPADDPGCRSLLSFADVEHATAVGDGICEFSGVTVGSGRSRWRADRVVLVGDLHHQPLPTTLHAEAHGVRFHLAGVPRASDYITRVTARPFELRIDAALSADGTLRLDQLTFESAVLGTASLAGVVAGLPADPGGLDPSALSLRSLRLHLDGRGFFELYAVPALAGVLAAQGDDIEATVAKLKGEAAGLVTIALGTDAASAASRDALLRALADLPHPDRTLDVTLAPAHPLTAIMLDEPAQLHDVFGPGSVSASYGD